MTRNHLSVRIASCLTTVALCSALLGCETANKVIWNAQSKSPDGAWLALAHTENVDGPGINAQWTMVEMKQNLNTTQPVMILNFDEDEGAVKDLKMNWVTSSHLDVTYRGNAPVTFQAIKAFSKDITVEHLP